jgi:hypothetical protein
MSTNITEVSPAFEEEKVGACKCTTCKENCVCGVHCQETECKDCSCGPENETHVNETILPESTQLCGPDGTFSDISHGSFVRDGIKE